MERNTWQNQWWLSVDGTAMRGCLFLSIFPIKYTAEQIVILIFGKYCARRSSHLLGTKICPRSFNKWCAKISHVSCPLLKAGSEAPHSLLQGSCPLETVALPEGECTDVTADLSMRCCLWAYRALGSRKVRFGGYVGPLYRHERCWKSCLSLWCYNWNPLSSSCKPSYVMAVC